MINIIKKEEGIYELDSGIKGPTVSILGGIHGNEICGIYVLDFLKENLFLSKGKIYLIYGNLKSIKLKRRQGKKNLNRMFFSKSCYSKSDRNTYEYKRAQVIKKYLDLSEVSFDLHSSPIKSSPQFIICERNALNIIRTFQIKKVCFGFDNTEPGGTDYYMNSIGKIGICIECGNHNDLKTIDKAFFITKNFLKYYGMFDSNNNIKFNLKKSFSIYKQEFFIAKRAYITETNNFKLIKDFYDFENIYKGQLIGYDGSKNIYSNNYGKILFARNRKQVGVEGFIEIIMLK